jgi:hypothetical protein
LKDIYNREKRMSAALKRVSAISDPNKSDIFKFVELLEDGEELSKPSNLDHYTSSIYVNDFG